MTTQTRHRAPLALCAIAALATAGIPAIAAAQGFVASEHDLQYRRFIESDVGVLSGRGAVEFEVAPDIRLQFDGVIGSIYQNAESENHIGSLMVHGVYDTGAGIDAGAFLGREFTEGGDATTIGIEGRFDLQGSEIQPWLSYSHGDGDGLVTLGLTARSDMAAGLGLDSSIIVNDIEGSGRDTTVKFTAGYELPFGAETFASVGYRHSTDGDDSNGEATAGLGVRIGLGRDRGTTFGSRTVFESLR